jgi:hypothetical protein
MNCRTRWQDNHLRIVDEPRKQWWANRWKSVLQCGKTRHGRVLKRGVDDIHDITRLWTTIEMWVVAKMIFLSCNSSCTARRVVRVRVWGWVEGCWYSWGELTIIFHYFSVLFCFFFVIFSCFVRKRTTNWLHWICTKVIVAIRWAVVKN